MYVYIMNTEVAIKACMLHNCRKHHRQKHFSTSEMYKVITQRHLTKQRKVRRKVCKHFSAQKMSKIDQPSKQI